MKSQKGALLALALFITALVATTGASMAAITAVSGISMGEAVPMAQARYGATISDISIPSQDLGLVYIFLSFHVERQDADFFTLESVAVDNFLNGNKISSEVYTTYDLGNRWNRLGYYGENSLGTGPMDARPILVGWGTLNSATPYVVTLNAGDVFTSKMTYHTADQGDYISYAKIENIPEPTAFTLIIIAPLLFLRRKRN